jgi:hypothetical protein
LRTVTFPFDEDIVCKIEYSDPSDLPEGTDSTIAVLNITGISKFAQEVTKKNASIPKIHLSFSLDSDGVVSLVKAEATSELPPIPDSVSKDDSSDNTTVDSQNSTELDENVTSSVNSSENNSSFSEEPSSTNSTKADKKSGNKDKKESGKKSKKGNKNDLTLRKTLQVTENVMATKPSQWTKVHIDESKVRLRKLQVADEARKAKEAALNELEAYIYKVNIINNN